MFLQNKKIPPPYFLISFSSLKLTKAEIVKDEFRVIPKER